MNDASSNTEIFTLDASRNFHEGVVTGKVGADARASYALEFCHGVDLDASLEAEIFAELEARLPFLGLVYSHAEGSAFAGLGVGLEARVNLDLFDKYGFSTELEAYAEAAVAARLAIGLSPQELVELVRADNRISDLACDIMYAFLSEVRIEAGVWGKAAVAAMGKAHFNIEGSLRNDDGAGFIIEMGSEAGVAAGAGFELFAFIGFDNPKRFFLTASERLLLALVRESRWKLAEESRSNLEFLELFTPITLNSAYELGQMAHANTPLQDLIKPLIDNFTSQSQRYFFDKLGEISCRTLTGLVSANPPAGVKAFLQGEKPDYDEFIAIYDQLEQDLESANTGSDEWRSVLTLAWVAMGAVNKLRRSIAPLTEANENEPSLLAGLGTAASWDCTIELPMAPQLIYDELNTLVGDLGEFVNFANVLDYLMHQEVKAVSLLHSTPHLQPLIRDLSASLGMTQAVFLEGILCGDLRERFTVTGLYDRLRNLTGRALGEDGVLTHVMNELLDKLDGQSEAGKWLKDVAVPSISLTSSFVFDTIDELLEDGALGADERKKKQGVLRTGLSGFTSKMFIESIVHLSRLLLQHVIANVHTQFSQLHTDVSNNSNHVLVTAGVTIADELNVILMAEELKQPWHELMTATCSVAANAFSPVEVWTTERWNRWQDLMTKILMPILGELELKDYLDKEKIKAHFEQLYDCSFIVSPRELIQLQMLYIEIMAEELRIIFTQMISPLYNYNRAVNAKERQKVVQIAEQIVTDVRKAIENAKQDIQAAEEKITQLVNQFADVADQLAGKITEISGSLQTDDARRQVLDNLKDDIRDLCTRAGREEWHDEVNEFFADNNALLLDVLEIVWYIADRLAGRLDNVSDIFEEATDLNDLKSRIADAATQRLHEKLENILGSALYNKLEAIFDAISLPIFDSLGDKIRNRLLELSIIPAATATPSGSIRREAAYEGGDGGTGPTVETALAEAMDLKTERNRIGVEQEYAQQDLSKAQSNQNFQETRQQNFLLADAVKIAFVSPDPISEDIERNWVYGPEVPLHLTVTGIQPCNDDPNFNKRIFLALNSRTFTPHPTDWSYDRRAKKATLRYKLKPTNSLLRSGLNILECSVTDGSENVATESIMFAENVNILLKDTIQVVAEQSCFDTPLDDHINTEQEKVVFYNSGAMPVNMKGWKLSDRAKHQYTFPEVKLLPGEAVAIHTGAGKNTGTDLFWGRTRAVWNNRGDKVFLLDELGVIHTEYQY
ncbi:MAG: lamin tail domain-containing protein [Gammaproteobacteria bacterium]|nr:lamin tail domain-containing protein [Gammaproteobacteria bacterium]